jgi:hypothetical protein
MRSPGSFARRSRGAHFRRWRVPPQSPQDGFCEEVIPLGLSGQPEIYVSRVTHVTNRPNQTYGYIPGAKIKSYETET